MTPISDFIGTADFVSLLMPFAGFWIVVILLILAKAASKGTWDD